MYKHVSSSDFEARKIVSRTSLRIKTLILDTNFTQCDCKIRLN